MLGLQCGCGCVGVGWCAFGCATSMLLQSSRANHPAHTIRGRMHALNHCPPRARVSPTLAVASLGLLRRFWIDRRYRPGTRSTILRRSFGGRCARRSRASSSSALRATPFSKYIRAATSAPGPSSPLPHLHRDWAHPCPHLHRDWAHRSGTHSPGASGTQVVPWSIQRIIAAHSSSSVSRPTASSNHILPRTAPSSIAQCRFGMGARGYSRGVQHLCEGGPESL